MISLYNKTTNRTIEMSSFVFPGGEVQVALKDTFSFNSFGPEIRIDAFITSAQDFMELAMVTDALRRRGATELHLVMKYVPYARQDRVMNSGEALAIRVFADLINALNFKTVWIWDPHSDVTTALIDRVMVSDQSSLAYKAVISCGKDIVLVAPDAGAAKKTMTTAKGLGRNWITAEKVRNTSTGEITGTRIHGAEGLSPSADFLMLDDLADGGRTFIELAKELRKITTGKIMLYVTHGIFSKGFEVFEGVIDKIYVANLWPTHTDVPSFVQVTG